MCLLSANQNLLSDISFVSSKPLNGQPALPELVDELVIFGLQPTWLVDEKSLANLENVTNQPVKS
jgi:hypothetical protein